MSSDLWQSAKELFRTALDQPAAEREAFVAKVCDDAAVAAEVMRLLRLHDESSPFLVSPMTPEAEATGGGDPIIGRNLGGFVIQRRIGIGGMGAVYEAQQEQPRRRAAVKILRPGIFAPRLQRRFEFESEFLAKLQHPCIAQVFAAGTFEIGGGAQPWFAMELIDGPPLQTFVQTHTVTRRRRIELLLSICDAVQHAHERGVVHRDLKPDNILIASAEDAPEAWTPRILDFGVARSIEADLQATQHTAAGEIVGTLAYMSPEQLGGRPDHIDARSDVYALGVIGYELLSGRLPHDAGRGSFAEAMRTIEHESPTRLGAVDASLRGDLEVIFGKALEQDVARRYQSAAELASDLRHYLNSEPISARPATAIYQLRKFARRHRALVSSTVAIMLVLAGGVIMYAREARTARLEAEKSRYEADKATAINNFMTNDFVMNLIAAANASGGGSRVPVSELVEQSSAPIATMFANQPLMEAAVRNEVATIYYNLGSVDQSADQFQQALTLWESQLGPDHPDTLKAVNNLGQARARQHRVEEAETLYRRALEGRLAVLGEDDPFTLVSMNNLAELCRSTDRLDEADVLLRRALTVQRRVHGINHKNTITTLGNLGTLVQQRGDPKEAAALFREAHDASRATLGEDHLMTAMTGARLGTALRKAGQPREAASFARAAVETFERVYGAAHIETILARRSLARIYADQGEIDQATEQYQLALQGAEAMTDQSLRLPERLRKDLDELNRTVTPR